jgi:hypothetical protein
VDKKVVHSGAIDEENEDEERGQRLVCQDFHEGSYVFSILSKIRYKLQIVTYIEGAVYLTLKAQTIPASKGWATDNVLGGK